MGGWVLSTVPGSNPAPRKLVLRCYPMNPEMLHVCSLYRNRSQAWQGQHAGREVFDCKMLFLKPVWQNWENKLEEDQQTSKWLGSGHSSSPSTLSNASRELSFTSRRGCNFKSCMLSIDGNQIIHSHAVAILVCSCGSFTWGLKLFWLKWSK